MNSFTGLSPLAPELEIELDAPLDIVRRAIAFMNGSTLELSFEDVIRLGTFALQYQIATLQDACLQILESVLTPSSVCKVFAFARQMNSPKLETLCLEFIDDNANQVLSPPNVNSFCELDEETAKMVLDRELVVRDELTVFYAVVSWGKKQIEKMAVASPTSSGITPDSSPALLGSPGFTASPNKRRRTPSLKKVIANLIHCVRFPQIPDEDLVAKVLPTGLLPSELSLDLSKRLNLGLISGGTDGDLESLPLSLFSLSVRDTAKSSPEMLNPFRDRKRPTLTTAERVNKWLEADFFDGHVQYKPNQ
jgi:hypothetical protein